MAKQCRMRLHAPTREFQCWIVDRRVWVCGWGFSLRFPLEGRSGRDAPVGVLVGIKGGHWKISLEKVAGSRVF